MYLIDHTEWLKTKQLLSMNNNKYQTFDQLAYNNLSWQNNSITAMYVAWQLSYDMEYDLYSIVERRSYKGY